MAEDTATVEQLRAELRQAREQRSADRAETISLRQREAALAIENARLLEELEARTVELTRALEQQTAFAEVLRVIAASPTDLTRVFTTVAERASRLYGALSAAIWQIDGDVLTLVADSS